MSSKSNRRPLSRWERKRRSFLFAAFSRMFPEFPAEIHRPSWRVMREQLELNDFIESRKDTLPKKIKGGKPLRFRFSNRAHVFHYENRGFAVPWNRLSNPQRIRIADRLLEDYFVETFHPTRSRGFYTRPPYSLVIVRKFAKWLLDKMKNVDAEWEDFDSYRWHAQSPEVAETQERMHTYAQNWRTILEGVRDGALRGRVRWASGVKSFP